MEVITLKRRGGIVSMNSADQNSRQLYLERQAHNSTRQLLQSANRAIQDLRTQLAHAQIATDEFRVQLFAAKAMRATIAPACKPRVKVLQEPLAALKDPQPLAGFGCLYIFDAK